MCFDYDSDPPIGSGGGRAAGTEDVVLSAYDGNRFAAYLARAAAPTGAGMVVLPDVRGLFPYYETLARRFAEAGVDAVAIDYFGRTAGAEKRGADFEFMPHVAQTTLAGLRADITAAAAYLLDATGGRVTALYTMGFCFGGRLAFISATMDLNLAGVIGFYGWPVGPSRNDVPAPADVADRIASPVLGIFGGHDEGISPEAVETFEGALTACGVPNEVVTYPGAPHGFFDRKYEDYATESADAWERVLAFVRGNAG
jgi:carboxymethylenebutenolidase